MGDPMNSQELLCLPWTYRVNPVVDGDVRYFELRIDELPDFFVALEPGQNVAAELQDALASFVESYTALGEMPPMPARSRVHRWIAHTFSAAVSTEIDALPALAGC